MHCFYVSPQNQLSFGDKLGWSWVFQLQRRDSSQTDSHADERREKKKKTTALWCQYVSYRRRLPLLFKYVNVRRHDSKQTFKSEVRWQEIIWIITCVRDDDVLDVCVRKPDLFVFELTDQSMVLQQTGPVYVTCSSLKAFQRRLYLIRTLSNCLFLLIESAPRLYSDKQPGSVCLARPDWV